MSHPTRVHALSILAQRVASPRELAEEIEEPLNNVTYHVNQLRELGCIELVRTEPRGGGRVLERFYRSTQKSYFDDEAWDALTKDERLGISTAIVKMMAKDLAKAMESGSFFTDDRKHVSRWPMHVDLAGWDEIAALLERTGQELFEIEARVAERHAAGEPTPIHANVQLMQFRSPPEDH